MKLTREYQLFVISKLSRLSLDQPELTGILGLAGETGELADAYKKYMFQGHDLDLVEEMGDVLFYYFVLLWCQGLSFEDVMKYNMEKLQERYPTGFDSGRSVRR